jgi:hypothetical protein
VVSNAGTMARSVIIRVAGRGNIVLINIGNKGTAFQMGYPFRRCKGMCTNSIRIGCITYAADNLGLYQAVLIKFMKTQKAKDQLITSNS